MEYTRENYHEVKCLQDGDMIRWPAGGNCRVQSGSSLSGCWMDCSGGNDFPFRDLGVNKITFCEKHYGYTLSNKDGMWPYTKPKDLEALTRVVVALFEEYERRDGNVPKPWDPMINTYSIF